MIKKFSKNEKKDQIIPRRFRRIPKMEKLCVAEIWNNRLDIRDKIPIAKMGEKSTNPICVNLNRLNQLR